MMRLIKMKYFTLGLLFTLFITGFYANAQQADSLNMALRDRITEQIELIAESTEEQLDYSDLIENYFYLAENPLNVNTDNLEPLRDLYLINAFQYEQLKEYLINFGPMLSFYELLAVEGFDDRMVALIEPLLSFEIQATASKLKAGNILKYGRHQLLLRAEQVLEMREGYKAISDSALLENPNKRYLGSPQKVYARYAFNYRNQFRAGVTMEKDPGEVLFKQTVNDSLQRLLGNKLKSGFDFYSVHAYASDLGFVKAIALGDYHLAFGQGLTMWSGLSFGKSTEAAAVMRYGGGVKPNTSVNENFFLRGGAVTLAHKNVELTAFYSNKNIDANVDQIDSVSNQISTITSLQESGLHRTVNELMDKNAINQQLFGGRLSYHNRYLDLGVTAHQTKLEATLTPRTYPYNQFQIVSGDLTNYGFDFRVMLPGTIFFGEIAGSDNGGMAGIAGLTSQPAGFFTATIAYRYYEKEYQNFFSNAFAESSSASNETGIYFGINASLAAKWRLKAYADHFQFPWLRYRTDAPSFGHDYFAQLEHEISRSADFYFRFRTKNKMINSDDPWNRIDYLVPYKKDSYRFHINYQINSSFTLKNRAEYIVYKHLEKPQSNGFIIFQDVQYRPVSGRLQLTFRYAIFDADTYDSRVYAYENDVLYAFSIPAFYEKGTRIYLLAKWSVSSAIDIWARIGQTWYSNRNEIGTGLEMIEGNQRTDAKLQMRIKF
ncbi:MAG: hypothetical protein PF694_02345 [Bacteroidetes bacterium]|jgi:hypothetical protein|nr:hypothetical protein [Bacteroidota bacterium]